MPLHLSRSARLWRGLSSGVAQLSPAYFAMVMATGIISIACTLEGIPVVPKILLVINVTAYLLLWALLIARICFYPHKIAEDLSSHARGPGFFTMVAASSVIGTQFATQLGLPSVAKGLWGLAFILWLSLTYVIFTALTIRREKPTLENGINGGWLTAVVATQSLVVLGCTLVSVAGAADEAMMFGLVCLWLAGGMLYIWMISLIFYRYTFFRFHPEDLSPPYWINMGAVAISTLAGALLILNVEKSELLQSLLPFLKGFTLLFWATATWWIPMLVILGVWRYVYHRLPLTYDPLYWGAVFPLGMYTVATIRLSESFHLKFLLTIPSIFVGLALTAWLFTFLGLVVGGLIRLRSLTSSAPLDQENT
ncbi:Putative C4-dicarboxylate transporter [gamma proteobacterium HdN1]|nr:Putative C4-dicarboxylate transporter [gamma proteobacterium HdN1]